MGVAVVVENGALVSRPTRDRFTFSGTLDMDTATLVGEIEHSQDGAARAAEVVTLSVTGASSELYPTATRYGQWLEQLAPILRGRDPQW